MVALWQDRYESVGACFDNKMYHNLQCAMCNGILFLSPSWRVVGGSRELRENINPRLIAHMNALYDVK